MIGVASSLVETDEEYRSLAGFLLGRIVVVDTIDNAIRIGRAYRHSLFMVTLAGESFAPGGSITGGAFKSNDNLLGRKREIAELTERTARLKKETETLRVKLDALRNERNASRDKQAAVQESRQKLLLRLNTLEMTKKQAEEQMTVSRLQSGSLEKEIITRACGRITEEHRWLYEENLRTYRHYAELPSENRGKNLLRLDNEFHRIAFLAVGREENYRIQFDQLQHIERMRMLSLHFMGQETNLKDHAGLYHAIAEGDLKTTLERLEVHMGRYRENLAAVQERYPNYFSMS